MIDTECAADFSSDKFILVALWPRVERRGREACVIAYLKEKGYLMPIANPHQVCQSRWDKYGSDQSPEVKSGQRE